MVGGPAGVLTTAPYFEFRTSSENDLSEKTSRMKAPSKKKWTDIEPATSNLDIIKLQSLKPLFHVDSPAGLLLSRYNSSHSVKGASAPNSHTESAGASVGCEFYDPHHLQGGFGRSTAEWIAAYLVMSTLNVQGGNYELDLQKAWHEYHLLFADLGKKPSGYDLLAQLKMSHIIFSDETFNPNSNGQLCVISKNGEAPEFLECSKFKLNLDVMIFKTRVKVKTHEHLQQINSDHLTELSELSSHITKPYLDQDLDGFLKSLKQFDKKLEAFGYKSKDSLATCQALEQVSHVSYARGCGALGADVIAVFHSHPEPHELRKKIAKDFDLIFIADVQGID